MEKETGEMTFPPLNTTNKSYCSVYGCSNRASINPSVRFHRFPRAGNCFVNIINKFGSSEKVDRLYAWKKNLRIDKQITPHMRVCSLHFKREDYILPDIPSQRQLLKKSAVPSCNLPVSSTNANRKHNTKVGERSERRLKRISKKAREETVSTNTRENTEKESSPRKTEELNLQREDYPAEVENEIELRASNDIPRVVDIGVQVQSGDLFTSFRNLIKTDKELSTVTGIESFKILNTIVDIVKLIDKDDPRSKMDIEGKVIMTFMKLKQNSTYALLSVLFKCYTAGNCKKNFYYMLDILCECLKMAIPWPSKDQISKNLPVYFKGSEDVRIVLDCTEISIQNPKKLRCELVTYSHYESTHTVKVMTGVTPAGLISFISEPYGGRVSDKAIFEQSSLIHSLEKKDAVMVDKGFLINDICKDHDIKLIKPPFLRNQVQFSQSDALLTASIAKE